MKKTFEFSDKVLAMIDKLVAANMWTKCVKQIKEFTCFDIVTTKSITMKNAFADEWLFIDDVQYALDIIDNCYLQTFHTMVI